MISAKMFGDELKNAGFTFYTGVPCSFLKNLINYTINECEYIPAANEGDAVAIASGAYLGGRKSVVLMQNSGLTNAISPLSSLNFVFNIPILGFVSLRGEKGLSDEPQHQLMGDITTNLLNLLQIKWEFLSNDLEEAKKQIVRANQSIEKKQTFFFIVRKNTFEKEELVENDSKKIEARRKIQRKKAEDQIPDRIEVLEMVNALKDNETIQLATTGKTGRELYEIEDAKNNLYMVGSMGCISSLGLGLALVKPQKDIVVIDGDGSLLMRMGSLATNGYGKPRNMLHILLDNNAYESTGNQRTVSNQVDFVDIAYASGYKYSFYIHNINELNKAIKDWKKKRGLTFLYIRISNKAKQGIGRPSLKPYQVKERLQEFIND